jgi:hypothetical protein
MPHSARADQRTWHHAAMTDDRLVSERAERLVTLLEDNVRTELQVTNDGFDLGLNDETIERLMQGVTSGVLYAFAVDWSPDWVKAGDVHQWQEEGRFFARCGVCLADSPPSPSAEVAVAWARDHEESH